MCLKLKLFKMLAWSLNIIFTSEKPKQLGGMGERKKEEGEMGLTTKKKKGGKKE